VFIALLLTAPSARISQLKYAVSICRHSGQGIMQKFLTMTLSMVNLRLHAMLHNVGSANMQYCGESQPFEEYEVPNLRIEVSTARMCP
jgi:hypothetical protein